MRTAERTAALRRAVADELRGNLLSFWRERSLDTSHGGFLGEIAGDGVPRPDAAKGLVLAARLLWTFAALYRELGEAIDLELARRALGALDEHFLDPSHGGYRWRVSAEGAPLDGAKKTYGQAFCIYALSEFYRASGEESALDAALAVFGLVERHTRDAIHGGYLEARAADWSPTGELRLGEGDLLAPKSMNTHLHLLEAYSNLYRAHPDGVVATRLGELLDDFHEHITAPADVRSPGHLRHFFDERWAPLSDTYTYGHDIEAVWLLCEAADLLGDPLRQAATWAWAGDRARAVLAEALDADGALAYEGRAGMVIDGRRDWWCQAEAVIGFTQAYELTGDEVFAAAAQRVWDFIAARMVDRVHGEWFSRVGADGVVDDTLPKVSEWKCPYHTVRMALEMMRRLGSAADGTER